MTVSLAGQRIIFGRGAGYRAQYEVAKGVRGRGNVLRGCRYLNVRNTLGILHLPRGEAEEGVSKKKVTIPRRPSISASNFKASVQKRERRSITAINLSLQGYSYSQAQNLSFQQGTRSGRRREEQERRGGCRRWWSDPTDLS